MPNLQIRQHFLRIADFSSPVFRNAPPKLHQLFCLFRPVEEFLISLSVLNDDFRLSVYGQIAGRPVRFSLAMISRDLR